MEIKLTKDNFDQEVLNSPVPVLVDFWAVWCGPCKAIAPVLEELSHTYEGKLKIGKLNVDDEQEVSMKYSIMSIPTLKIFKDGKIAGEIVGAAPKSTIEDEIKKHI
ncbi:MAG TPA: thioredoxin [Patescibacteria group bacterium]|nr:thioredoxin [Patescibacteria group bacterium]